MKCVYKERDWLIILSYHRDDVLIILSVILIILGYIGLGLVDQAWWVGIVSCVGMCFVATFQVRVCPHTL